LPITAAASVAAEAAAEAAAKPADPSAYRSCQHDEAAAVIRSLAAADLLRSPGFLIFSSLYRCPSARSSPILRDQ